MRHITEVETLFKVATWSIQIEGFSRSKSVIYTSILIPIVGPFRGEMRFISVGDMNNYSSI